MLHILNKSPFATNALDACLRVAQPGQGLLLIEDAVYAACQGTAAQARLEAAAQQLKVYVLQPDLDARGMSAKLLPGVTTVDYGGFVDLVERHNTSQSWL
ncbi:MAG: sulfurtransferase complex subunit TusB [Rhodoferax sp.]